MNVTAIVATQDMSLHEMARCLLEGIECSGSVELDISGLAEPDLWTIQLIEAARREAAVRDVALSMTAPAAPALRDVLRRGGFLTEPSGADVSFWFKAESVQ